MFLQLELLSPALPIFLEDVTKGSDRIFPRALVHMTYSNSYSHSVCLSISVSHTFKIYIIF